jgi:hypothetical protein
MFEITLTAHLFYLLVSFIVGLISGIFLGFNTYKLLKYIEK